jgi:hypothetical protein
MGQKLSPWVWIWDKISTHWVNGYEFGKQYPNPITHGYFIRVHLSCLYKSVETEPTTKPNMATHQTLGPSPTRRHGKATSRLAKKQNPKITSHTTVTTMDS